MSLPLHVVTYRPPSLEVSFRVRAVGDGIVVEEGKNPALAFTAGERSDLHLKLCAAGEPSEVVVAVAAEFLFGHLPALQSVTIGERPLYREEFFQDPLPWLASGRARPYFERWTEKDGRAHPRRPSPKAGLHYRRYVPAIRKEISFRLAHAERDLVAFHRWQNDPRVAKFWELDRSEAELGEYLRRGLADPHQFPLILEFDGVAAGYFEVYWTAEDRLGPYYDYAPFDRGFHFLIGEPSFLGFPNTDAVIKSMLHYLLLDDPRTRNVMAEPRHDNTAVLRYVDAIPAWKKLKEFDFPHKRAALLECRRERFFGGGFP